MYLGCAFATVIAFVAGPGVVAFRKRSRNTRLRRAVHTGTATVSQLLAFAGTLAATVLYFSAISPQFSALTEAT